MKIKLFRQRISPEFYENCYLLIDREDCVLVDPGGVNDKLKEELKKYNLKYILITHAHYDHLGGVNQFSVPVYISKLEKELLENDEYNYANHFEQKSYFAKVDFKFFEEKFIAFNNYKIEIINTPGHTKGGVCFLVDNKLLSGDTIFSDSVGRTDLYSGSAKQLQQSIKLLKTTISNNVKVYPGHGYISDMKEIKRVNSFFK